MDANVTTSQSEHEHDNSSLQNPSTNPAEAGTTDETRDEDHETSSIEALNWSEVEEEELAAAQQATLVSSAAQGKLPTETSVNSKPDKDDESVTNNGSSNNDEGSVLSTMLLQSINSSVSDEDPQARKLTVIENWASEVTNAVERGEIEMAEDFPDENGTTGDDEEGEIEQNGVRKRKGKKLSPEMVSSMMSSVSNGDSTVDPLSNAPVLDDGPIWNKGPRSYTFQENRRFNQKLTFCLLIAVVLAIGLGLGNLVAHQECEAEYKATQQSQMKPAEKISVQTVPTATTPAPIIPDRSTDSSMMGSTLPKKQPITYTESSVPSEKATGEDVVPPQNGNEQAQQQRQEPDKNIQEDRRRKRDDPVIDPKYRAHAETVSNVVHTLDRLSREIDQFENTTRKLQGVLMIPEEKTTTESPILYDEEIHRVDDDRSMKNSDEITLEDEENEEDETAVIEDLIDAIEQTPDYLELKKNQKRLEELNELNKNLPRSKLFSKVPTSPERESDIASILKSIQQFKDFERRFIKSERKRLRDEGKYKRFSWRLPEEYSAEEKNALRVRYRSNWDEFLKLIQNKVPDPIEALFGAEEDEEERTYGDVFHFPFPDPDDDLTPEEYDTQFRMNLEEAGLLKKSSSLSSSEKTEKEDAAEDQPTTDSTTISDSKEDNSAAAAAERLENLMKAFDDLIVIESKEEHHKTTDEDVGGESSPQIDTNDDMGKSIKSSTIDKVKVRTETPVKSGNAQYTKSTAANPGKEGSTSKDSGKLKVTISERETSSKKRVYKADNVNPEPVNNLNEKKIFSKAQTDSNGKTEKFQAQKQKDLKTKQGKQKIKNVSNDSSNNAKNNNYKNSMNVNNGANNGNGKMYSKGKKLGYLESNKAFKNIQGKSIDNRRDVSPETQRKFGADTKYSDTKIEKNFAPGKRSPTESTKYKKDENGGHQHDETSKTNQVKQKVKRQAQVYHETDNQKIFNSKSRNYKNRPNNGPSRPDLRDSGEQKRQENPYVKRKHTFSEENVGKVKRDSSAEGIHFRQQTGEFIRKHDNRNSDRDHNSSNHPNGKRSKSWLSKDRADRREKSR